MRSHTKFGTDRFSRFDVFWIQTNRNTDKQGLYLDIISSDPLCKDANARFTTLVVTFAFLAHEADGEIIKNEHFSCKKKHVIFHTYDRVELITYIFCPSPDLSLDLLTP